MSELDPLSVRCPICESPAGASCANIDGEVRWGDPHPERGPFKPIRPLAVALEREHAELAPFRPEEWRPEAPRVYAPWPWCPRCEYAIESPAEGWRCPECEAELTPSAQELERQGGLP